MRSPSFTQHHILITSDTHSKRQQNANKGGEEEKKHQLIQCRFATLKSQNHIIKVKSFMRKEVHLTYLLGCIC